jgi:hypothetical protein
VILGGFVQLGGSSQTTQVDLPGEPEVDRTEFGLVIGPKIEAMFSPGNTVRPFIGAGAGFLLSSVDDEDTGNDTSLTGVELLGRIGLRAFAAEGFSIDPSVVFGWATASGEVDTGPTNVDTSGSAFNVGLGLGFSGLDPLGASCFKEHRASRVFAHCLGSVCGARLRRQGRCCPGADSERTVDERQPSEG